MKLNIREITVGKYTIVLQQSLTTAEAEQWHQQRKEEDAAAHVAAIASNHKHIEALQQEIEEIQAGRHDTLIAVYREMGREETRETRIADAKESIAQCERNLAWFAESPHSVATTPATEA